MIIDAAGNLYGTTQFGGNYVQGSVYELTPTRGGGWMETVLHSFQQNGTDGIQPVAGLTMDAAGNLYGTTFAGGPYNGGTVFELTPSAGGGWTETVLHNFNHDGSDGYTPEAGLVLDAAGDLYGTTHDGGTHNCGTPQSDDGCGTVFELSPASGGGWTETVLHSFSNNGLDGIYPFAGPLIFDAAGNLYGTTYWGGAYGVGTVFELRPNGGGSWTEAVLHNFKQNGTDGGQPLAGLIFDTVGNLYGTTGLGGTYDSGTVFELTPSGGGGWTESLLYSFCSQNGCPDGNQPQAGLVPDADGNLYGTTNRTTYDASGTVFELTHLRPCTRCTHTEF